MTKPEWGSKLSCPNCGASFYSMQRPEPACPKCQTVVKVPAKSLGKTVPLKPEEADPVQVDTDLTDDDPELDVDDVDLIVADDIIDDEDEDTLMVDASDLGEDDDDMSELKEHMEPSEENPI